MSSSDRRRRVLSIVAAVIALLALTAALRLIALELRPPHHDEGVNGTFTEKVVKRGHYVYDPENYHGPSYFYVLAAAREALGFGLWQLRLPGALIGIVLCFAPLLLRRQMGWRPALLACALLATSPTLVYYARYAIHETLLVALGLLVAACMLRWADRGSSAWLIAGTAAIAAMIATKETTILFLGVSGLWMLGEIAVESLRARRLMVLGRAAAWSWRVPVVAAASLGLAAAIHVLMFTGFLQQPGSIAEQLHRSVKAYFVWSDTGTGDTGHAKDACYYVHLGVRYELALYLLAILGLVTGFRRRWVRGPGVVGFGLLLGYSLIAYKMPWLPASWLALLALPAAHGVGVIGRVLADELSPRLARSGAVALALVPALLITARSSFVRPADRREALAYVHTAPDYNQWFPLIEAGGRAVGPQRLRVAVEHVAQWPLPWSLSPYPRTEWGVRRDADVIIVAVDRAPAIEERLHDTYYRRRYEIRDSAPPAYIYFRSAIYDRWLAGRAGFERIGGARMAAR